MRISLMSDFVPRPVSRGRLAEAFRHCCPRFAAWCDDGHSGVSQRQLLEDFAATWQGSLELCVPRERGESREVRRLGAGDRLLFCVDQELAALKPRSPTAAVRLRVLCTRDAAGSSWACSVVAQLREEGTPGMVFYDASLLADFCT